MLSFNNAFSDSILLYRCSVIWSSSPYHKFVVGVPSIFILTTFALGLWGTFITVDTSAPFVMALVTNLMLLVLSAGRIWRKGRQASVVLGPEQRRRYNSTVEIICESSLLYLLNVTVYTVASIVEKKNPYSAPVTALSWGSLAQVVNIVPMMIMVRVGIAKSLREPDPPRVFYGGNGRRASDDQLGMALLPDKSKATAKYGQIGQPSGI
ncbi:hypothetical protein C8R46DRAFT_1099089 [Mycena filopes]|nr:hypothetical protein C8R46DRAFT_1099089 [Mycena filopes]